MFSPVNKQHILDPFSNSTVVSPSFDVSCCVVASAVIQFTGSSIAGTFKLQASNKNDVWVDVPASTGAVVSGTISGPGNFMITTGAVFTSYGLLRLSITSSDADVVNCTIDWLGKG